MWQHFASACSNFIVMLVLGLLAIHFLWDPVVGSFWQAIHFLTVL